MFMVTKKLYQLSGILCLLLTLSFSLYSCSEESGTEDEYADWQTRNDAIVKVWANDPSLTRIKSYTEDPTTEGDPTYYVYVKKLEETENLGSPRPLFTDTVRVAYRGRLIPSASYPNGYVFDQSFIGDFSWKTSAMTQLRCGSFIEGFTTALMDMRVGDRWLVYIPYQMAYGSGSSTTYPAYSNMIFEIALFDCWHPGEKRPPLK